MKTKTTKRKFYDKWCYKITLNVPGISITRLYDSKKLTEFFQNGEPEYRYQYDAWKNKDLILCLTDFLKTLDPVSWNKRIERNRIDIYTNDKSLYDDISLIFQECVIHRFEPNPNIDISEDKVIKSPKLPHNKFKYKVYLLPHKLKDKDEKVKYTSWIQQQPKISITESVTNWFHNTFWNWDRRYIWVEDQNTLLMLKLRNPEVCGSIYEYRTIDK